MDLPRPGGVIPCVRQGFDPGFGPRTAVCFSFERADPQAFPPSSSRTVPPRVTPTARRAFPASPGIRLRTTKALPAFGGVSSFKCTF